MERKDLRSYKEHKSTKYQNKWGGGEQFWGNGKFLSRFSSSSFRQEGSLKAMIYKRLHSFLPALIKLMK